MTEYRLERVSAVDLVFTGELIAEATTDEGTVANIERSSRTITLPGGKTEYISGADRWQVVRVYRTDRGRWVIERTGCSREPDEGDRCRATVCDTPDEVREAVTFVRKDGLSSYVTDVGYEAISLAAQRDPRLQEALVERV